MNKDKDVKIYFKLDSSIKQTFEIAELNLEGVLEQEGMEISREEVSFDNDSATRSIAIYVLYRLAEVVLGKLAEKTLEKLADTALERVLKPVLDYIKKEEPEKKVEITILVLADSDGKSYKTVDPATLNPEQLQSIDKLLIDIKEKMDE